MHKVDELFEQYRSLRLQGQSADEAQRNLMYEILALPISTQLRLKQHFQAWEAQRTVADVDSQERLKFSNRSLEAILCPACESPNNSGLKSCQVCGAILIGESPEKQESVSAELSNVEVDQSLQIILFSPGKEPQLHLSPQLRPQGLRLGRYSPETQIDVDLTELGAEALGVSRLHALLEYDPSNLGVYLTDLASRNGSFVNGLRLPAQMRSRLNDGDEVRLGRLHLRVSFRQTEDPAQS